MISKTKKERRRVELSCVIGVSENESHSVMSYPLWPHGLYSPWNSPGQNTGISSLSLLQGIFPTQGLNLCLPTLQVDSLPAVPQEKPKNTGVSSLSLLQWIFLTLESKHGVLHCRWILYQLSYQGSPDMFTVGVVLKICSLYGILYAHSLNKTKQNKEHYSWFPYWADLEIIIY